MNTEKRWLSVDGPAFIRKIGIRKGHTVVDFGCGTGYYTFPASIVVQSTGRVYALDIDEEVIRNITTKAKESPFANIIPLLVHKDLSLELGKGIADVVLLFDVLHYFNVKERKKLFSEIHGILKNNGLVSVYPKHYKFDFAMWSLANMDLEDIIKEITEIGYRVENSLHERLFHFYSYTSGYVINLRKV
jgi:ubiquinone/menaquinone biosynthesis C-methylase UbiE